MIKKFKFAGIALLSAALSLSVASCEKQTPVEESQPEVAAQEVVSFAQLTKGDAEAVDSTAAEIEEAIKNIVENIVKELGDAAEAHQAAVDSIRAYLFDQFTWYMDYHNFDSYSDSFRDYGHFYAYFYDVAVRIFNKKVSGTSENFIRVSFQNNVLYFTTIDGYGLSITFPGWYIKYTANDFPKFVRTSDVIKVSLTNSSRELVRAVYDFGWYTTEVTFYDKEKDQIATIDYKFDKDSWKVIDSTFVAVYDNTKGAGKGVSNTSIRIAHPKEVVWAVERMGNSYVYYNPDEAEKTVNAFNTYVKDATGADVAWLSGSAVKAVVYPVSVINAQSQTGFIVQIVCETADGAVIIDEDSFKEFIQEYFATVIDEWSTDTEDAD